ncbi:MAG: glycosyltransferase family 4 protein, partial [Phycisphaeraceae bacterium]
DKGFDMLVEAAAHLRDMPTAPAWVIAGEGEMKPELEARARQLGLNVCTELPEQHWQGGTLYLPGMVRGVEKRRLFQASSIVAFPTRPEFGESFGMVLLEAMAAGRAVVASDLPIVRELIEDERNGRLVPPRDAAAWAQAIRALLADPAQRQRMQQQNLADARQYDWSSVAERMHEVYETVTNRSRAGLNQG